MTQMSSLKFFIIFVFPLSLSSSLFTFTRAAKPFYLNHFCSAENFTRNSTYQSNLNFLLSSLRSKANSSDGFSNAIAGQDPNRVYGLFQCRGDVSTSTCQAWVADVSNEAIQRCPAQKGAVIWYDECLLHYNASDFFSTALLRPFHRMSYTNNVEPYPFYQRMLILMNESATQAADDPKRFATKKGDSTTFQTLYTLAQCTQDMSSTGCAKCLQEAISLLPKESIGVGMFLPSCRCRFEIYPFYTEGKSRISSSINVAIVVPVTVSVLLFVAAGYCFLTRRARKKYNAVLEETGLGALERWETNAIVGFNFDGFLFKE